MRQDALFVPPAPRHVVPAMEDLVAFIRRRDLPTLAQAAIAHAQFETVHRAIARLVEADVLVETTGAKRNRVWVAKEVTAALDDFGRRIGRRRRSR